MVLASDGDKTTEYRTIKIPTENDKMLRITNLYIPPVKTKPGGVSASFIESRIGMQNWPSETCDLILGDCNAHSVLWDDNHMNILPDTRGGKIEDWMASTGMACLNTGEPTHHKKRRQQQQRLQHSPDSASTFDNGSAPDISLVHPSLLDKLTWEVVNELGSDHMPIIITYDTTIPKVNDKPTYKWNHDKADWTLFTNELEDSMPKYLPSDSTHDMEKKLRKAVIKAANRRIGKKKITQDSKCWFTPEINQAIKTRNQHRDTIGESRVQWTEACAEVDDLVKEAKRVRWREYVDTLDMNTDSRKVWRTIRAMDGRSPPQNKNEVLEVGGVAYVEDKAKAEQFAKTYRSFANLPTRKEDRKLRKDNRRQMKAPRVGQRCEEDFTMTEMTRVIEQMENNKAAGEDDITYEMMKHFGPKAKEYLLTLYNRIWRGEQIPTKWLTATIKPLLKDGKDPKDTVSYRPISLTSCPGKVKEKMTADRLMRELESRGLLNENQAGFRQNRCTTDQILKLVQDASDQIHSPGSNRLIATFYDYEKAYDKVWRDGLIHKMIKLGVPHRFVVYVRQFLATRSTRVEVNGRRSNSFFLKEGLPQGSSISPLLFLIYINDIDVDLHADTVASLFADDTATWLKDGKVRGEHRDLAQQEVNKIQDWATLWKMRINSSKTKCMITSTSKADRTWNPKLDIDGKQIDLVQLYKFLGTSVENDLRFVENMNAITVKSRKRVNILKCLATKSWGNSLESQRALFIQYTRSVMEYASNSWNGWIAVTYRKKLQRVQNEALRSIAGLAKTCPVDFLHLETGVEPIECRLDKNDQITWERYARLPASDSRRQLIEKDIPPRLKSREGFRERTRKGFEYHNLVRDTTSPPLEPWLEFPNLTFDKVHLEQKKENYSELELN